MKLGVFDSGLGGEAVAASLSIHFPKADIRVVNDRANVPYGSKTPAQIIALTDAAIQPLLADKRDVIIIACNTATMVAIKTLREKYPAQTFIGLEPMVKPAAEQTKTGVIAVCATPVTLASERYRWLVDTYAKGAQIVEPDCSQWASLIENGTITRSDVEGIIKQCLAENADVIVLGCTHYHWIKDMISDIAGPDVLVLEPSDTTARRIESILRTAAPHSAA